MVSSNPGPRCPTTRSRYEAPQTPVLFTGLQIPPLVVALVLITRMRRRLSRLLTLLANTTTR
jgi:hypothetical protein